MLNRGFEEFVVSFNAHAVQYLVVGGDAPAAHGLPRYTGDSTSGFGRRMTTQHACLRRWVTSAPLD